MGKQISATLLIVNVHYVNGPIGYGYMIHYHGGIRESVLVDFEGNPLPEEWYGIDIKETLPTIWTDGVH